MKNILITGGSGFIGSHTILEILRNDSSQSIIVFDNFKNGSKKALETIEHETGKEIKIYEGDLLQKQNIEKVFEENKIDAVIHFAALIEAGISMKDPALFFENNINGSVNLIRTMQKYAVKKIVFSSTAAVYGNAKEYPIKETADLKPENWYGYTKLVVENLLRSINSQNSDEEKKIDSVILRYFNAAGAEPNGLLGENHEPESHLIPLMIFKSLGRRESFSILGNDYDTLDGTCIRDYIHVCDLAFAHLKALKHLENFEGTTEINIATGKGSSVLEVINCLKELDSNFSYDIKERRPGDPARLYADNSKAKEILNWEPKYDIKDMVKHAYEWFKNNPDGYK